MAGVITLAEDLEADSEYTGDAQWVEAGLPITIQVSVSGSGASTFLYIEGSLDGSAWATMQRSDGGSILLSEGLALYPALPAVNYIRARSGGTGDNTHLLTAKAIQPNNVQVDVDNLPA